MTSIDTSLGSCTVRIGRAEIGPSRPTYLVAEAGVNHNGRVETACKMARVATDAGASAIKYQAFRADRIAVGTAPTVSYQQATGSRQQDMLRQLELSPEQFALVYEQCRRSEIEFLATPFAPQDVAMLARLGVRALKFASTDIVNLPLLEAGMKTGLPMIVSTGAATLEEIDQAVQWFDDAGARDRLILLHCVSSYPVDPELVNLRAITTLRERYACPVGFSDHTTSTTIGGLAVAAGASLIEKHFTLGQTQDGPDHAFSLEPAELACYVSEIRRAERFCGNGHLGVLECEQEVRRLARGSVVAARDLQAGQTLAPDDLAVKRPGNGINPAEIKSLFGRSLQRDVAENTPLTIAMLD